MLHDFTASSMECTLKKTKNNLSPWGVHMYKQRKTTTQMNRNIISFFSFSFITQNGLVGKVRESRRRLSCTHKDQGTNLQWTPFSSRLYSITDARANSRGHTSSWPLSQCTWSRFLLARQRRNLRSISAENTCALFTLSSRCISSYFYSTKVQLPPLHQQMLKGSSSQYPTHTCPCCNYI